MRKILILPKFGQTCQKMVILTKIAVFRTLRNNSSKSACTEEVQNSLINYNPDCLSMSEEEFLNAIEKIVTKSINPSVHKMSFRKMYQKENEDYVIRLKSFAVDCEFTCPSCKVDISEINIKDQFITGINNEILQTDMLAKADKLSTLCLLYTSPSPRD